jgi:hypothetical protein
VVTTVAATWALDDYAMRLDAARRPQGSQIDRADLEQVYARSIPPKPITERAHFDGPLRVKAESGEEVSLDFSRGRHLVVFAGCAWVYVARTAGQLANIADADGAELTFVLVSEAHPDDLPSGKSGWELEEYRTAKVREFLGPNASIYFDVDHGAERSMEFTKLNLLYIEDGWQLYRMTPPGQEGRYQLGVGPFLSWWGERTRRVGRNNHPAADRARIGTMIESGQRS